MQQPARDQADGLRALAQGTRKNTLTLAVTSGKGGVGKSSVAVNLSICAAANGLRVTLVDLDLGLANADLLLDLHPRYTVADAMSGARRIEDVCLSGPGGIRFVPGASGLNDLADLSEFERQTLIVQLQRLETNTDILILDCGAGISRNVTAFALASDQVLVVTTPQAPAVTDAYATIKTLVREQYVGRLSLFVNMARSRREASETYQRIAGVSERFLQIPIADGGSMLHDVSVELAVRDRCPFVIRYPGSNASACIAAAAAELARSFSGRQPRGGFFKRVVGLFV